MADEKDQTSVGRPSGEICRYTNKAEALFAAKTHECRTERRHYVARGLGCWILTTNMPLLGEWYDAYGYRHG